MPEEREIDLRKSLLQLDPEALDALALDEDAGRAVVRLANTPLRRFQAKDLYIMLSQGVGLHHFVPMALDRLEDDPQLQALSHPGDLLTSLLSVDARYWRNNRDSWEKVMDLVAVSVAAATASRDEETPMLDVFGDDFAAALVYFSGIHKSGAND